MELTKERVCELVPRTSHDYAQVAPGIYLLRAFSPAEAGAAVTLAELSPFWTEAQINAGDALDREIRRADVLYEELHQPHARMYRDRLEVVAGKLAGELSPGAQITEMQFIRYPEGGRYRNHRDVPGTGARRRVLSVLCYLNDDFSGGGTTFIDGDVSIVPASGAVVAFLPELLHRAEPVVSGKKYAITAWYGEALPG